MLVREVEFDVFKTEEPLLDSELEESAGAEVIWAGVELDDEGSGLADITGAVEVATGEFRKLVQVLGWIDTASDYKEDV